MARIEEYATTMKTMRTMGKEMRDMYGTNMGEGNHG
jgi:hypothetical protein